MEPLSIKAAAANAEHNGVAACLAPYLCSASVEAGEPLEEAGVAQQARQFDVVVANILQASCCLGFGFLELWKTLARWGGCQAPRHVLRS